MAQFEHLHEGAWSRLTEPCALPSGLQLPIGWFDSLTAAERDMHAVRAAPASAPAERTLDQARAERVASIKAEAFERIAAITGGPEPWRSDRALMRALALMHKKVTSGLSPEEQAAYDAYVAAGAAADQIRTASNDAERVVLEELQDVASVDAFAW
jgi:hypothetical protein